MARVRFTKDFDFKPTPQVTIGYLSGWVGTVRRVCADQAIGAGKAVDLGRSKSVILDKEPSETAKEA